MWPQLRRQLINGAGKPAASHVMTIVSPAYFWMSLCGPTIILGWTSSWIIFFYLMYYLKKLVFPPVTASDFIASIQTVVLVVALKSLLDTLVAVFARELPRVARVVILFRCWNWVLRVEDWKSESSMKTRQVRQLSSSDWSAQSNSPSQNQSFCLQIPSWHSLSVGSHSKKKNYSIHRFILQLKINYVLVKSRLSHSIAKK